MSLLSCLCKGDSVGINHITNKIISSHWSCP